MCLQRIADSSQASRRSARDNPVLLRIACTRSRPEGVRQTPCSYDRFVERKRAEMAYLSMQLIDIYTLDRALTDLTQEEFMWEPHPGAWAIRRRSECTTPTPHGAKDGEWIADYDSKLAAAADRGRAIEPMTTIGWLLTHFASAPGIAAELEILGGPTKASARGVYGRMWSYTIYPEAGSAIDTFRSGWSALRSALANTSDDMLEREYKGFGGPQPGAAFVMSLLNEVSHHGTQICALRDLYRQARG